MLLAGVLAGCGKKIEATAKPGGSDGKIQDSDSTRGSSTADTVPFPVITAAPVQLVFPPIAAGSASVLQVVLNNVGPVPARRGNISISGSGPFSVVGNECSDQNDLPRNAGCPMVVRYAPTAVGNHSAELLIEFSNNSAGKQVVTIPLVSTAKAPAALAITDGAYFNFLKRATGGAYTKSFTVQNQGSWPAVISGFPLPAPYSVGGGTCPGATLAPNASCSLVVNFAPSVVAWNHTDIPVNFHNGVANVSRNLGGIDGLASHQRILAGPFMNGAPHLKSFALSALFGSHYAFDVNNPETHKGIRMAGNSDFIFGAVADLSGYATTQGPGGYSLLATYNWAGGARNVVWAYDPAFRGGVEVAACGNYVVTAPGPGGGPLVRVWDARNLAQLSQFWAYDPAFLGGVSVACADVNNDGVLDIVTAPLAGGGPDFRVYRLDNGAFQFAIPAPYAWTGGFKVATGDVDGNGVKDIIFGQATGSTNVLVFSVSHGVYIRSFYAYPNFGGGVTVAGGDLNHDGIDDIITGAGPGGGAHLRAFAGTGLADLVSFNAFENFGGGLAVGYSF